MKVTLNMNGYLMKFNDETTTQTQIATDVKQVATTIVELVESDEPNKGRVPPPAILSLFSTLVQLGVPVDRHIPEFEMAFKRLIDDWPTNKLSETD